MGCIKGRPLSHSSYPTVRNLSGSHTSSLAFLLAGGSDGGVPMGPAARTLWGLTKTEEWSFPQLPDNELDARWGSNRNFIVMGVSWGHPLSVCPQHHALSTGQDQACCCSRVWASREEVFSPYPIDKQPGNPELLTEAPAISALTAQAGLW